MADRVEAPKPQAPTETGEPQVIADEKFSQASQREFVVETKKFVVTLNSKGAVISSIILKDLKGKGDTAYPELLPSDTTGALSLKLGDRDLSQINWVLEDSVAGNIAVTDQPQTIQFTTELEPGRTVSRSYTFFPDSQFIKHAFSPSKMNTAFALNWASGLKETERIPTGKGLGLTYGFFSEVILNDGSSILRETFTKSQVFNESSGVIRWVGLRRKYVAVLVNFNRNTHNKVIAVPAIKEGESKSTTHTYRLSIVNSNLEDKALDFNFVIMPLRHKEVIGYQQGYESIIFSGWEKFFRADIWYVKLCGLVLNLLNKFYAFIPNYGIAIILLTLLVRGILFPLTISQTRSMSKVQEHAPAIKEIKAKHKGNPQKANREVMAYYKEAGINPMAPMLGCFPMFLQLPVFIALFNVLGRAVELKEAPFVGWISDLSRPDILVEAIQIPFIFPAGMTVLPFFMAITMYFQMKMTITDPNQKAMVYMMPVMMFIFSASFPSGLVVYWTVSNVFTIGQTWLFQKRKARKQALEDAGSRKGQKTKRVAAAPGGKQKKRK